MKPTIEGIIALHDDFKEIYNKTFEAFLEDERFYNLDFLADLKMPDEFKDCGIVLPTARDMIDANVDHIDVNNAKVKVNRANINDSNYKREEAKRKFCLGVIWRTNVENTISPWRVAAKHYALHGVCHLKTVWDADLWYDKPVQGDMSDDEYGKLIDKWNNQLETVFPIQVLAVHPACLMPDPYHIVPECYIETHTKKCYAVMNAYDTWTNPKSRRGNEEVDWIEYWDGKYRAVICDGESILEGGVVEHPYGFIPYVTIEAGLGNHSSSGCFTDRYVGSIRHMKDILVAESRAYSIAEFILKKGAYPSGFIQGPNVEQLQAIDNGFGRWTPLPEGVNIFPMKPEVPPDSLRVWLDITSDYISAHAAPRSSRGLSESGVRSGADRRLVMSEASLKFAHSIPAFRHGTAKVLENCIKIYKYVIPNDIRLWSNTPADDFEIKINREDLREPFNCDVEFAPIGEEDEIRRHDDLRLLVGGLNIPRKWAWKQLSNVDPLAMEKMADSEKIEQSQGLMQAFDSYIAQRASLALQQKEMGTPENVQSMIQQASQPQQSGIAGFPAPSMNGQMTTNIPQPPNALQALQNQNKSSDLPMNIGQGQGGGGSNYVR